MFQKRVTKIQFHRNFIVWRVVMKQLVQKRRTRNMNLKLSLKANKRLRLWPWKTPTRVSWVGCIVQSTDWQRNFRVSCLKRGLPKHNKQKHHDKLGAFKVMKVETLFSLRASFVERIFPLCVFRNVVISFDPFWDPSEFTKCIQLQYMITVDSCTWFIYQTCTCNNTLLNLRILISININYVIIIEH